jgi:hypothetical protein
LPFINIGEGKDMESKTLEEIVEKHYEELFREIVALDDNLYDLVVQYKGEDGKTIQISWLDREARLKE